MISISTLKSHSAYFQLMPEFFSRRQICSILSPTETQSSQQLPMIPESNSKPLSWCQRLPNSGFHLLSLHIMLLVLWPLRTLRTWLKTPCPWKSFALSPFVDQLWVPLSSFCFCPVPADPIRLCMIDTYPTRLFWPITYFHIHLSECRFHQAHICLAYISLVVCLGNVDQDCFGIIFPFPGQFVELGTLNPRAVGSAG